MNWEDAYDEAMAEREGMLHGFAPDFTGAMEQAAQQASTDDETRRIIASREGMDPEDCPPELAERIADYGRGKG